MIGSEVPQCVFKLMGKSHLAFRARTGKERHSQANGIALSRDGFADRLATVAGASKTVEPGRFDVIDALLKSVANEIGIPGSLRTKAKGRQHKARLPKPAQFRLTGQALLVGWCLRKGLLFVPWVAARKGNQATGSKSAQPPGKLPARDVHHGVISGQTIQFRAHV